MLSRFFVNMLNRELNVVVLGEKNSEEANCNVVKLFADVLIVSMRPRDMGVGGLS